MSRERFPPIGKKLDPSDHLRISYLPEKTYLDLNANGKETLRFFEKFYPDFDRKKACRLMEAMDLDLNQPIKSMSKGDAGKAAADSGTKPQGRTVYSRLSRSAVSIRSRDRKFSI